VSAARKIFLIGFLTCCAARGAAHLDAADDKTLELFARTKAISEDVTVADRLNPVIDMR
jgi:hypothetical protein